MVSLNRMREAALYPCRLRQWLREPAVVAVVWAAAVVAAAHVPFVTALFPILRIFGGRFGAFVMLWAVASALAARVRSERVTALPSAALFALAFAVFAGVGLHHVRSVQATGDEPEYLLMTQSLGKEHDLDVQDNWKRGDFLEYVPGMGELPHGTTRKDGRPISTHSPGLPALLALPYAIGGRTACALVLALLAAAMALQVRALALQATGSAAASLLAWAAAVGPPAFHYSFHVYTEIPSAFALAASLRILLGAPGPARAALAALLVSALPWLHVKTIPAVAVLGLVAVLRLRGRSRAAFLAVAALMAAAYVLYYEMVFGTPTPLGLYRGRVPKGTREAVPLTAAFGIFLDRAYGLLPYAPVWIVALGGLPALLRRSGRDGLPFVLVAAALFVPILTWRAWFAGFCPPARFLVPVVPVLAVALALRGSAPPRGLARWTAALLLFGLLLLPFAVWQPSELFVVHAKHDPPRLLSWLMGQDLATRYLPSFTIAGAAQPEVAVVWSIAFLLLLALDALAARQDHVDRLLASPGAALAFLLGIGLAIDLSVR
jgi:hypothetical protein